jgi:hypothetical protein
MNDSTNYSWPHWLRSTVVGLPALPWETSPSDESQPFHAGFVDAGQPICTAGAGHPRPQSTRRYRPGRRPPFRRRTSQQPSLAAGGLGLQHGPAAVCAASAVAIMGATNSSRGGAAISVCAAAQQVIIFQSNRSALRARLSAKQVPARSTRRCNRTTHPRHRGTTPRRRKSCRPKNAGRSG